MRILFFVSNLSYPPIEGAHARTIELICYLNHMGHDVTLYGFLKKNTPFDMDLFRSDHPQISLHEFIRYSGNYITQAVRGFFLKIVFPPSDIIHFEGFATIGCATSYRSRKILSLIDPWALRQKRKYKNEKRIFKRLIGWGGYVIAELIEKKYLRTFNKVHLVSSADAIILKEEYDLSNVQTIPVSFDFEHLLPYKTTYTSSAKVKLVFWADLNVNYLLEGLEWFVDNVFNEINKSGRFELYILGRMHLDILIERLPMIGNINNVNVVSWLPDLNVFLSGMDIAVLPDPCGTGLKNRTIHSMALALPTIGSIHAFEGIPLSSLQSSVVCSNRDKYIRELTNLACDEDKRTFMGTSLRRIALENYSAQVVNLKWHFLYSEVRNIK